MFLHTPEVDAEEERLRGVLAGLDERVRKTAYLRIGERIRDPDTYATLNWFFICGLHHFYLGKYVRGGLNLLLFAFGALALFTGQVFSGLVLITLVSAVELYALFRSQVIVKDHNNRETQAVLEELAGQA